MMKYLYTTLLLLLVIGPLGACGGESNDVSYDSLVEDVENEHVEIVDASDRLLTALNDLNRSLNTVYSGQTNDSLEKKVNHLSNTFEKVYGTFINNSPNFTSTARDCVCTAIQTTKGGVDVTSDLYMKCNEIKTEISCTADTTSQATLETCIQTLNSMSVAMDESYKNATNAANTYKNQIEILIDQLDHFSYSREDLETMITTLSTIENEYQSMNDAYLETSNYDVLQLRQKGQTLLEPVLSSINNITIDTDKQKPQLEQILTEKQNQIVDLNEAIDNLINESSGLKSQLDIANNAKTDARGDYLLGLLTWATLAFISGFIVLTPWFKRYAGGEENRGFLATRIGITSPLMLLLIVSIVAFTILFVYLAVQGYIMPLC